MEAAENEQQQYVAFPLSTNMHETIISHEEICEPVIEDCVLPEVIVSEVDSGIAEVVEAAVEILAESSDPDNDNDNDNEDDDSSVYPIYIKQEDQQPYTSGDDESMAVEALRQLGGMYPCFNEKKISCPNCASLFTQLEMAKHHPTCAAVKLSCTTCGERFERKIDLNNHVVCHQVDRPHACRTCGNLFRSKANLQSHMAQVHQAERPHKCNICNSNFQRPSSLSNHMKIHTYVAGRAIMQTSPSGSNSVGQSVEPFRKWPDNGASDPPSTPVSSGSVPPIPTYEVTPQVHWSIPTYNFTNDQAGLANHHEKMDTLHDFAVMPAGEVAQFEYTQQQQQQQNSIASQINQYNLAMNSFASQDGLVKIESLPYSDSRRSYVEVEMNDGTQHTCGHCGSSFARASALATHEKVHTCKNWSMPVECEYCDKQFQDGNCLATHQTTCAKKVMRNSTEHGGLPNSKWGKHACADCGKKFTTKQKMFRHQWIHRKKTHSCEVCGAQFEKQHELDEHRLSAHPGESAFTCGECGKSFVSRQGLWEHARTHAGSPAHFHCDVCSKTFSSRQGYLIHHRTHTGERPYGCKYCWKAFRDGGTLRKHERIHTGERPHVCPLCSRAFNQKVVLREHVRWVHAAGKNETEVTGPPFRCPLCGSLNQDREELCAHIVKHSDQMIAEAKAKTNNNASKPKQTKKKSKASTSGAGNSSGKQNVGSQAISRTEQNEALLSISDPSTKAHDSLPQILAVGKPSDALVLIATAKRNEALRMISEVKENDLQLIGQGKQQGENHLHIPQINHRESLSLSGEDGSKQQHSPGARGSDGSIGMQAIGSGSVKQNEVVQQQQHLVSQNKQSNTLHLISKQNESLPVLTIPNPQNHENFSSQIAQINNAVDVPMNMVTQGERDKSQTPSSSSSSSSSSSVQKHSAVIQVQYQQRESDDGEEPVCGMCGEEFTNKNLLMEHVKIHI